MADDLTWRAGGDECRVGEIADLSVAILRLAAPSPDLLARAAKAVGVSLPTEANTAVGDAPRVLWLAPGEWAILPVGPTTCLADRLTAACDGSLHHFADLMEGWTAFEIEGAASRQLIANGCSLDLHPRVFGPDRCAQTLMAQVPVLLERRGAGSRFMLYVDRSFAGHMRAWLRTCVGGHAL